MASVAVSFPGRILFLATDPDIVERQLAGEDLTRAAAGPLRDGISTDEITPSRICAHSDERLGEYAYLGVKCGDAFPFTEGRVRRAGFAVSVAGRRYGRGSSREQSPFAERSAGIRLVIAESFERIYRQNCINLGIFTSTDFGLVERIQAGRRFRSRPSRAGTTRSRPRSSARADWRHSPAIAGEAARSSRCRTTGRAR